MKILNTVLLLMIVSCGPVVNQQKLILSQDLLVNKVLVELQLNQSEIHLYYIQSPQDYLNETILVFAEEESIDDQDRERYTSHIVIANSITGKIKNYFSEKSIENGWVSDALFIDEVRVDTTTHKLNETKTAFGVIVRFRNNSQPSPYEEENLSLFIKEDDRLKKVLDNYTIYESIGEVNVSKNACGANFKIMKNKLSGIHINTNGYYDIRVNSISAKRSFNEDENGDCNPIEKKLNQTAKVLKYNGEIYK